MLIEEAETPTAGRDILVCSTPLLEKSRWGCL